MPELRRSQLRAALAALATLAEVDELGEYPRHVAEELRRVIPCHHAGYTAVELGTDRVQVHADPPESVWDGGPEAFARFAHQNPLLSDLAASGAQRTGRLSDYMSSSELHRTDLYDHVYRHIPLEYQIGAPLRAPGRDLARPAELVGVSLVRVERDFTDSEKLLVELMRPALSAMLGRLHELAMLRAAEAANEAGAAWALLCDGAGQIGWASAAARSDLDLHPGRRLPRLLLEWALACAAAEASEGAIRGSAAWGPLLSLDGTIVQPRLVAHAYPGMHAIHLRALRPRPTLAALMTLGLTERQAQVMQLVLAGRSGPQIASALGLSPRTVEKHMDAIYTRIGAANRTEAVLIAGRALDP